MRRSVAPLSPGGARAARVGRVPYTSHQGAAIDTPFGPGRDQRCDRTDARRLRPAVDVAAQRLLRPTASSGSSATGAGRA